MNKLPKKNQSVGKLPTVISSINYGKVVGKVEGNLQSGDEIPKNFVCNLLVIYLGKFRRDFVGEFVGNPLVIGDHFYKHFVCIPSVIFYEYT